jgi:hypothetical protein
MAFTEIFQQSYYDLLYGFRPLAAYYLSGTELCLHEVMSGCSRYG